VLYQSGHSHSHGGLPAGHGHSHGGNDAHDAHDDHGSESKGSKKRNADNINIRSGFFFLTRSSFFLGPVNALSLSTPLPAFVHVLGDTVQTIGVLIAGIIIMVKPEYKIADPICTFIFSALVLLTTYGIVRDALHVLMEGTPSGLNLKDITADLLSIDGVHSIHGLHAWSITIGRPALSVHVLISKSKGRDPMDVLREALLQVRHPPHDDSGGIRRS